MLHLRTLGELRLTGPDGDLLPGRRKELVLLAYLAQRAPRAVRRAELVDLLWGEREEERARHSLRQALLMLRRTVGEGLMIGPQAVTLASDVVELDLVSFDAAVTGNRLRQAVELWGGDFLFAAEDVGDDAYRVWLEGERERARRRLRDALERLVAEAAGDRSTAIIWAERWTELLPLDEQACYRLVEALYVGGRTGTAQARHQEYVARLRRELGVEPSPALVRLGERVAAAEVQELERVGTATLVTPVPVPLRRRRTRPRLLAGSAIVAALLIGIAVLQRTTTPRALPTVAVGLIAGPGGVDSLDMALSIGGLLAVNLARVPGLPTVSGARIHELVGQLGSVAGRSASLAGAARHAGADEVLEGTLQREPGGRLRLALRRVDLRTGAVPGEFTVVAADAFALVDSATARFARGLGLRAPALRVADVTTSSITGYGFYEQGLRSFSAGDYGRALPLFEAALALDSGFAMAAFLARNAAVALGRPVPGPSIERLDSLAARGSDRERLLIRATVANALNDPSVAALAESLTIRYPAEPEGHLLLATTRISDGDFLDALPLLRRVLAMDSLGLRSGRARCLGCEAFVQTATVYTLVDSLDAAERVTREWIRVQPGAREAWRWLGLVLAAQGRYEEGAAALRTAGAASRPDIPDVAAFFPQIVRIKAGDFAAADHALAEIVRTGPPQIRQEARWYLVISLRNQGRLREAMAYTREYAAREPQGGALLAAQLRFESGRFQEAARIFDSLAAFPPRGAARGVLARHKCWMLIHLATSHAAAGDTAALAALVEPLRAWGTRSAFGRDRRLFHHANGLLLVERGRLDEAAAEYQRAIYSPTQGYTRTNYELARTLLAVGRARDAIATLQSALHGPLDGSNLYVTRTELHELLARAHEAGGRADSAAAHYRTVLAAWRNADPLLHSRRNAVRERLAALGRGGNP